MSKAARHMGARARYGDEQVDRRGHCGNYRHDRNDHGHARGLPTAGARQQKAAPAIGTDLRTAWKARGEGARVRDAAWPFIFGALAGTIYARCSPRANGPLYGIAVWAVSYLGWIPAIGLLAPATRHRADRTLLMLLAHAVWGLASSATIRQLERAQRDIFAPPITGGQVRSRRR